MKIYSLTGKSGTGKSYQAVNLCKQLNIESIIDDGLFICRNKVAAGISAKRQPSKIRAVKTALFWTDEHRDSVMEAINRIKPSSLLVLGTSDEMVDKILARLELGKPIKRIYIEDITTEEDRKEANKQRMELGKHVIPVPTFQIKKQFSGYFMSPMRIFKDFGHGRDLSEKSVVRPSFSYMGEYNISEKVMSDIVDCVSDELKTVAEVNKVIMVKEHMNLDEEITLTAIVDMKYGGSLVENAKQFQQTILDRVQEMTAFHVSRVDIDIRDVIKEEVKEQ